MQPMEGPHPFLSYVSHPASALAHNEKEQGHEVYAHPCARTRR